MTRIILILFICSFLGSCTNYCRTKDSFGADEFVLDSYKIKEGKLSILELEGVCLEELDETLLEERADFIAHSPQTVEVFGSCVSSVSIDRNTRLFDLLCSLKITPDANFFKSYVLREGKILGVDLRKLVKEADMSQNIVMRGGDKVYIADASSACLMVMGEVRKEQVLALPDGFMPLRQALAASGGIPYTGDKSYIQVIRGSLCQPKIYTLSWEHIIHLPNESLLLMPGDLVYVAPKPITEWHRFISQLIPSLGF